MRPPPTCTRSIRASSSAASPEPSWYRACSPPTPGPASAGETTLPNATRRSSAEPPSGWTSAMTLASGLWGMAPEVGLPLFAFVFLCLFLALSLPPPNRGPGLPVESRAASAHRPPVAAPSSTSAIRGSPPAWRSVVACRTDLSFLPSLNHSAYHDRDNRGLRPLMQDTLLVTGGAGFIGSNFILDWFKTASPRQTRQSGQAHLRRQSRHPRPA